jgi:hypothetical protein
MMTHGMRVHDPTCETCVILKFYCEAIFASLPPFLANYVTVIFLVVRRIAAHQILQLLNEQVRKWGIDIRELTLSDPKVKQVMILTWDTWEVVEGTPGRRVEGTSWCRCRGWLAVLVPHSVLCLQHKRSKVFFRICLRWAGPRPHIPFPSRPPFVCKFSRHGDNLSVLRPGSPSITVLVFPDFADAYSAQLRPIDLHNFQAKYQKVVSVPESSQYTRE